VNERTTQRWFKWFVSGNLSLEDEQQPGCPRIWDSEATKEAAEQQPSTSTCRLTDTIGPSKSTIHRQIAALKKFTRAVELYPMSRLQNKPSDKSNFVVNYFSC
jgi:hypothetical protein